MVLTDFHPWENSFDLTLTRVLVVGILFICKKNVSINVCMYIYIKYVTPYLFYRKKEKKKKKKTQQISWIRRTSACFVESSINELVKKKKKK